MDISAIREDFPILKSRVNDKSLVYLDNAATTQKPRAVVEAMNDYYYRFNSNVHRGVHTLSQRATDMFESARECVRRFINADKTSEVLFTRGTTESLNLLAETLTQSLKEGDEILVGESEHHSNIVPWQIAAKKRGLVVKPLPIDDEGRLRTDLLERYMSEKTRILSLAQVTNAFGVVNDLKSVFAKARTLAPKGLICIADGAQGIVHCKVDVRDLGCDFYAFSGHKIYAPMGIGVLYGREELLSEMPPYQGGGEMIKEVRFSGTTFNEPPFRFEAGTPSVADALGLKAALEYVEAIGKEEIVIHEDEIMNYAVERLSKLEHLNIYAPGAKKAGSLSFNVRDAHPFDVGTLLDQLGIAVRTGHHCAQPLMERFKIVGTVRASFALYSTRQDVDALVSALERVIPMLG